ncbi:hypothetical protein C8E01_101408 [Pontibacter virosus]|uniref:Uncharacterized protein n=1 Tax=Pontibacter virosus TaxID=1765052 RepID=A0A2U1B5T0_9BACT|nr:hypothetical protein C8E01_101408 [Pontibacter virosus]
MVCWPQYASIANALCAKPELLNLVALRQAQCRHVHLVQAIGMSAGSAAEVNVIMLVPVFIAGLLAKCITGNTVCARDAVQQTMLLEGVQGPVQRYTVKLRAKVLLNGGMGQGMAVFKKQTKHLNTALRLPKPIGFE